jgi:2-oxo-3-hexenedioate decarboxylase
MAAPDVARGEQLIGVRLGGPATRQPPWRIDGDVPDLGWLTGARRLPPGQPVPAELISPRVVPHLAVVLGRPLTGPGVSPADALAAVASVHAALELAADSAPDMPADSSPEVPADSSPEVPAVAGLASGAGSWFVVSPAGRPAAGLDLALEACLVEVGGQVTDSGTGAAAAGHPAEALAWAANALDAQGLALEPGWLVFTGPLTAPVPLPPATPLAIHFTTLGSLFLPPP